MLNDEIKDYWEGESYVYSDIIKKSLNDEGKNAWADLVPVSYTHLTLPTTSRV